jgi:hypothetical protein
MTLIATSLPDELSTLKKMARRAKTFGNENRMQDLAFAYPLNTSPYDPRPMHSSLSNCPEFAIVIRVHPVLRNTPN